MKRQKQYFSRISTMTRLLLGCGFLILLSGCSMPEEDAKVMPRFAVTDPEAPCDQLQSWEGNDWQLSFEAGEIIEHEGNKYQANVDIAYPNAECVPDNPVFWCANWFTLIGSCEQGPDPTCDDGIMNQDETGIDCGGVCPMCIGGPCNEDADCISGVCSDGVCALLCADGETQSCGSDIGACMAGIQYCVEGTWSACEGAVLPAPEVCDPGFMDEDCDGIANENCDCNDGDTQSCGSDVGACVAGTQTCESGTWSICQGEIGPAPEVCDPGFMDEDCDGDINEGCECTDGDMQSCGSNIGACVAGTQTCANGMWTPCAGAIGPSPEVCDPGLMDEDCDGIVNEGCACSSDDDCPDGVCEEGICVESAQTCNSCVLSASYTSVFSNDGTGSPVVCDAPDGFNPSAGAVVIPIVSISVDGFPAGTAHQYFSSYTVNGDSVTVHIFNSEGNEVLPEDVVSFGWNGVQTRVDILWTTQTP